MSIYLYLGIYIYIYICTDISVGIDVIFRFTHGGHLVCGTLWGLSTSVWLSLIRSHPLLTIPNTLTVTLPVSNSYYTPSPPWIPVVSSPNDPVVWSILTVEGTLRVSLRNRYPPWSFVLLVHSHRPVKGLPSLCKGKDVLFHSLVDRTTYPTGTGR